MSTAPAGTLPDQPPSPGHQPGPWALLAATAVGGVIATRLGRAPLMLAAGAAALALMQQQKRSAAPRTPHGPPPEPPPAPAPPQSQVEEWLSKQMLREQEAPVVALDLSAETHAEVFPPPAEAPAAVFSHWQEPAAAPEEDYHPGAFLLDEADLPPLHTQRAETTGHDAFALLTEPRDHYVQLEPPPPLPEEPPPQEPEVPLFPHDTAPDTHWARHLEPLPSLTEAEPFTPTVGSLFFSAAPPPQQIEPAPPPPAVGIPVFEGASFPDEIEVPSTFGIHEIPAVLFKEKTPAEPVAPQAESLPAEEPVPEIEVQLASPGEASFDAPLEAVLNNPWQTPPEAETDPAAEASAAQAAPAHTLPAGPVVDAEIILLPRAQAQPVFVPKSRPMAPSFAPPLPTENGAHSQTETTAESPFPNPMQPPRSHTRRPGWNSWWQGD